MHNKSVLARVHGYVQATQGVLASKFLIYILTQVQGQHKDWIPSKVTKANLQLLIVKHSEMISFF